MKGKRLEASHLEPDEKNEVLKYATVACVLIAVGFLFSALAWLSVLEGVVLMAFGGMMVAFIWAYVGTLEAERSRGEA